MLQIGMYMNQLLVVKILTIVKVVLQANNEAKSKEKKKCQVLTFYSSHFLWEIIDKPHLCCLIVVL